jgi:hypothetical protein
VGETSRSVPGRSKTAAFFWDLGDDVVKNGEAIVMSDMTHEEVLEYLD